MITLKYYDLDGREVRPEDWANALVMGTVKNVIDQYQQRALARVAEISCPVHGGTAKLTFHVKGTSDQPSIQIEATSCCDEFAQKAVVVAQNSWAT